MIFVDTNILIDVLGNDPTHADWSQRQLDRSQLESPLGINPVVYAEIAPSYATQEALDAVLATLKISIEPMARRALFLAGKAHFAYRRRGGRQSHTLPDFFIGAQAAALKVALITRDTSRYRTYFPSLVLISPEKS